jgi:hypothetical protein
VVVSSNCFICSKSEGAAWHVYLLGACCYRGAVFAMRLTLLKCDCCHGAVEEMASECDRVVSSMCVRAQGGLRNMCQCFKSGRGGMIGLVKDYIGEVGVARHT